MRSPCPFPAPDPRSIQRYWRRSPPCAATPNGSGSTTPATTASSHCAPSWRTFRVDRISPRVSTGPRFTARPLPHDGDVAAYVSAGLGAATWKFRARIRLFAPADTVAARLPGVAEVIPVDDGTCEVVVGSDTVAFLAHYIGLLDVDFEVLDSDELRAHVARLADRYARAATRPAPTTPGK